MIYYKTEEEIDLVRKSSLLVASTHAEIQNKYKIEFIERIGNTERHRAEKIRFEIAKNTAKTNENRLEIRIKISLDLL